MTNTEEMIISPDNIATNNTPMENHDTENKENTSTSPSAPVKKKVWSPSGPSFAQLLKSTLPTQSNSSTGTSGRKQSPQIIPVSINVQSSTASKKKSSPKPSNSSPVTGKLSAGVSAVAAATGDGASSSSGDSLLLSGSSVARGSLLPSPPPSDISLATTPQTSSTTTHSHQSSLTVSASAADEEKPKQVAAAVPVVNVWKMRQLQQQQQQKQQVATSSNVTDVPLKESKSSGFADAPASPVNTPVKTQKVDDDEKECATPPLIHSTGVDVDQRRPQSSPGLMLKFGSGGSDCGAASLDEPLFTGASPSFSSSAVSSPASYSTTSNPTSATNNNQQQQQQHSYHHNHHHRQKYRRAQNDQSALRGGGSSGMAMTNGGNSTRRHQHSRYHTNSNNIGGNYQQQQQYMSAQMLADLKVYIQAQVEYYFSVENLCRDIYLRKQMDAETGFVPVSVLAAFNRLRAFGATPELIKEAVASSTVVELGQIRKPDVSNTSTEDSNVSVTKEEEEGGEDCGGDTVDCIRKREQWQLWIIVPDVSSPPVQQPPSVL